jgi:acyl-CoA reductase-like NAD-dependent aldehyde dehydrogenase
MTETVTMPGLDTPLERPDRFYIDGSWVAPTSDAKLDVVDPTTEEVYFQVAEAMPADIERAVAAARTAFDRGPWPRLTHAERAVHLRALGAAVTARTPRYADLWPRESGIVHALSKALSAPIPRRFDAYADLAAEYPWEEPFTPTPSLAPGGTFGLLVREPVGVVVAIVPWNAPMRLMINKVAPALIAGCTVIVKGSPQAPSAPYLLAEAAAEAGLPPGVINVLTADREVSELLVRDPRVDKIAFTGSTEAGRRIASLCGERIARYTLELGGKSAAVICDDADFEAAARHLAMIEAALTGQVCGSLTRIIVPRHRHDEFAEALGAAFGAVTVGDPFDASTGMGPLAMERQRDRVERYIQLGLQEGARLVTGGGRPAGLDRGWFVEPTVFAGVGRRDTIAQDEIFGPVLAVLPADDDQDAI